jgi:hypothetical protein
MLCLCVPECEAMAFPRSPSFSSDMSVVVPSVDAVLEQLLALSPTDADEVLSKYWSRTPLPSVATFLSLSASERRQRHEPIAAFLAKASVDAPSCLFYSPEDWQCTVCFTPLLEEYSSQEPPYSCARGHLLCMPCAQTLPLQPQGGQKCPTCAADQQVFQPVPCLQKLAAGMLSICPHAACGEVLNGSTRALHLRQFCPCREVPCPICGSQMAARDLVEHVLQNSTHEARHHFAIEVGVLQTQLACPQNRVILPCQGYVPWSEGAIVVRGVHFARALNAEEREETLCVIPHLTVYALGESSDKNPATARLTFTVELHESVTPFADHRPVSLIRSCGQWVISFKPWTPFELTFKVPFPTPSSTALMANVVLRVTPS